MRSNTISVSVIFTVLFSTFGVWSFDSDSPPKPTLLRVQSRAISTAKYNLVPSTSFRYGNWGGPGWSGGQEVNYIPSMPAAPVDDLDTYCQNHDYAYSNAIAAWFATRDAANQQYATAVANANQQYALTSNNANNTYSASYNAAEQKYSAAVNTANQVYSAAMAAAKTAIARAAALANYTTAVTQANLVRIAAESAAYAACQVAKATAYTACQVTIGAAVVLCNTVKAPAYTLAMARYVTANKILSDSAGNLTWLPASSTHSPMSGWHYNNSQGEFPASAYDCLMLKIVVLSYNFRNDCKYGITLTANIFPFTGVLPPL
jgi:hypothetical protein